MQSHKQQQNAQRDQEQMRAGIIARILTPEARERSNKIRSFASYIDVLVSRISIVKPERARALEDLLISSARSGQLRGSSPQGLVTESDLVGLLERFTVNEKNTNRITFQRRGGLDDDDDY